MIQIKTETDREILRQVALLQEAEIERMHRKQHALLKELAALKGKTASDEQLELQLLQEALEITKRRLYAPSSERRKHHDRENRENQEKKTGHGPRKQPELPIFEEVHELDEPDKICPICGGALHEMAGQFEEAEEITVVQRSFRLVKHKRKKYACRCGACVDTALAPPKLIPGGRYAVDFAVQTAISKYLDHLPLERQVRQMMRQGLTVDSQTLWDQLYALSRHLLPSYRALQDYVLAAPVIGADETRWRLLKKKAEGWWVWSATREDAVFYLLDPSRGASTAAVLLKGFSGVVVADGYSAYGKLRRDMEAKQQRGDRAEPAFTLAHCWAHARRKFVTCEPYDQRARVALRLIERLYLIERQALRQAGNDADEATRLALLGDHRSRRSTKIVKAFRRWMVKQQVLPQSGLGKAIRYALHLWPGLTAFLDNPRIPLDNNHTEREMRPIALGRKNHYGSKSKRGTEVAAILYSLLGSAKLAGLNPETYLREATLRAIANPGTVTLPTDLLHEQQEQQTRHDE